MIVEYELRIHRNVLPDPGKGILQLLPEDSGHEIEVESEEEYLKFVNDCTALGIVVQNVSKRDS